MTIHENVIDCTDSKELGFFIEGRYFKVDSIYYNGQWKYITGIWTRLWRDGTIEQWADTIIIYQTREKQL